MNPCEVSSSEAGRASPATWQGLSGRDLGLPGSPQHCFVPDSTSGGATPVGKDVCREGLKERPGKLITCKMESPNKGHRKENPEHPQ